MVGTLSWGRAYCLPPDTPDWLQQLQTFGIFAAGYLARPLGGIVMAHFGDLLGRKRMFTFGIFLMSIPTLLLFKHGQVAHQIIGALPKSRLVQEMKLPIVTLGK